MRARTQVVASSLLIAVSSVFVSRMTAIADTDSDAQPDLPGLIACRADVADYGGLAMKIASPDGERALDWKPVQQPNAYLKEYELRRPISVFGYSSRRIVFASAGIMAVLDHVDPKVLATKLNLTSAGIPGKQLFSRTIKEQKDRLGKLIIRLNVSTVDSHPDKVLAGCEYRFDVN